jgi:gliding motility-associated lipoprotein GldD
MKNREISKRQSANYMKRVPLIKPFPIAYCIFFIVCIASACNSDYNPRPRGYFRIDFPQKEYQTFDSIGYPYTFEYPKYAVVTKDSVFFDERPENWINIDFPQFEGRIHISYKRLDGKNFDSLVTDAYDLSSKQHIYKASGKKDSIFSTPNGNGGVYFILKGNTATGNQFFVTDSVKHFLRGALYFSATPNSDSLRPVNDFLRKDVEHLISTLKWK